MRTTDEKKEIYNNAIGLEALGIDLRTPGRILTSLFKITRPLNNEHHIIFIRSGDRKDINYSEENQYPILFIGNNADKGSRKIFINQKNKFVKKVAIIGGYGFQDMYNEHPDIWIPIPAILIPAGTFSKKEEIYPAVSKSECIQKLEWIVSTRENLIIISNGKINFNHCISFEIDDSEKEINIPMEENTNPMDILLDMVDKTTMS